VYREQEFVERCSCDAPAVAPCEACNRARCARHRERGLCIRCTEAIRRELARCERRHYWIASTVLTSITVAAMFIRVLPVFLLGFPLGFATYVALRRSARRQLIQEMGPALAASKGELLPEPEERWEPPPPPSIAGV
jgi:hypothetical protein